MYTVKFESDEPFVYSVFGIQYPTGKPSKAQEDRTNEFNSLITGYPSHIDCLMQDGCASISHGTTFVWLAYWKSNQDYQDWWNQKAVSHFWNSLPSDSGIWREILTPSPRRSQYGTNQEHETGMGHLGSRVPLGDKAGYWGCYRDRMADSATDTFASHLNSEPVCLMKAGSRPSCPGRVQITHYPDNLCFVVEGQDHSALSAEEREYWFENFDASVNQWIKDLLASGPDSGILDARLCFEPEKGTFRNSEPRALNYNKKVQLFYFKDLRHMERIGRLNKGHVDLRKRFLESYGPEGAMAGGNICLWVETTVLKADEVECEYIGCAEGTGFMRTMEC
jgi:hypothetical protein